MSDKPETAESLIERLERETGQRIDDNDGDNFAMAGLFGALSRIMGRSPSTYRPEDDVFAGTVVRHQTSPECAQEQGANEMLAAMLASGLDPDVLRELKKR